jgi:hypothetical protein
MASQIDQPAPDAADFLDSLSDEDLALFADSLAVQRELEAEDAAAASQAVPRADHAEDEERLVRALQAEVPPIAVESTAQPVVGAASDVIPLRPVRRSSARTWFPLAAAAVLVLALAPFAWQRLRGGGLAQPSEYVALLSNPNAPLSAEIDEHAWVDRGPNATVEQLRHTARAGAYVVDLQLAIQANDTRRVSLCAQQAAGALNRVNNDARVVAAQFQAIGEKAGGDREELLAELAAATKAAQDVVDRDRFALGGWAEAARIAALRKDTAFFRSDGMRDALDRAERTVDGDPGRAALQAIRIAADAEPLERDPLLTAINHLFKVIA